MPKEVHLVSYPKKDLEDSNFSIIEKEIGAINENEIIVKNIYISVDPYLRTLMSPVNTVLTYAKPFELSKVIPSGAVGEVVQSKSSKFAIGDKVVTNSGWTEYAVLNEKDASKLDENIEKGKESSAIGVLGMPGMTAYFSFLEIGAPKENETVLVSTAAGAVGSLVGQIAKIKKCRVIGITSTEEKVAYVKSLGFDECINYKTCGNIADAIRKVAPEGIDIYYDNVGGETLAAAVDQLRNFGRIIISGAITEYDSMQIPKSGPSLTSLIGKNGKIEGFACFSRYLSRFPEGIKAMSEWIKEGKIKYHETFVDGIDNTVTAMKMMLDGKNIGKVVVRV